MRLVFTASFPEEVRKAVEPLVTLYSIYLPHHCREVWVDFSSGEEGPSVAATAGDERYGFAKLWIKPNWLKTDAVERENSIAHEIAHMILYPLAHFSEHIIEDTMEEESPGYKIAQRALEHHLETTVQALAEALVAQQKLLIHHEVH